MVQETFEPNLRYLADAPKPSFPPQPGLFSQTPCSLCRERSQGITPGEHFLDVIEVRPLVFMDP